VSPHPGASPAEPTGAPVARPVAWPEAAIGLGLLVMAAVVAWQTATMATSPMYAKVGPRVFPYLTAGGLALLAGAMVVQGLRGGWQLAEEREVAIDWPALGFVAAGLLCNVMLIDLAGFTIASTVMFTLIAHGFGSRSPLRDAGIAMVFALACYFGFARALGVNIGGGVVELSIERILGG